MIFTALLHTTAYRILHPKWAFTPMSGAGAAEHGGRVNRRGVNALYLSLDTETALAEYKQIDPLLPPGTIVTYTIMVNPIVDFRDGFSNQWDELWQDFYCDWRRMLFYENIEPPSWVIGDQVRKAGGKGVLYKSNFSQGTNLVLYTDDIATSDKLEYYDPHQTLPKNQDSWQS